MFKDELQNEFEIADYILEFSSNYVDTERVLEYFFNCRGVLKNIDIDLIQEDPSINNHIRDKKKEIKYAALPQESMPPLVVWNSRVVDGHHRLRVAKIKNQQNIFIYDIT